MQQWQQLMSTFSIKSESGRSYVSQVSYRKLVFEADNEKFPFHLVLDYSNFLSKSANKWEKSHLSRL